MSFGAFAHRTQMILLPVDAGALLQQTFRDSPKGLFSSPPPVLHASSGFFHPGFLPEGTSVGEDADFLLLPSPFGKDLGNPVLWCGYTLGITSDSPGSQALVEFLKSPIATRIVDGTVRFSDTH